LGIRTEKSWAGPFFPTTIDKKAQYPNKWWRGDGENKKKKGKMLGIIVSKEF